MFSEKVSLELKTDKERILKGSRHIIECEIIGNPRATHIWWTHNDNEMKMEQSAGVKTSLVFHDFQLTDEGHYICYATNAAGTSSSDRLSLTCIGL